MKRVIASLLLALAVIAAPHVWAEDGMTGAELTALLSGDKTIGLGGPGTGYDGKLALNADGTGKGEAKTDGGDVLTLTGTWRIEGDQFCRAWKEFDDGDDVCETWVPDGANRVKVLVGGEQVGINYW